MKRHAGVALIGTFVADAKAQNRRFAISADGRLLPADKLKADSGSPFHGYSIRELGLPVAFARRAGANAWHVKGGDLEKGEPLGWREFIPLTGRVREIGGVRIVQARDGRWLRSQDVKTAQAEQAAGLGQTRPEWIDIGMSVRHVLWEGDRPVYATLVSTGKTAGEPGKTLSTPAARFASIKSTSPPHGLRGRDHEFELATCLVMVLKGGYALNGAYWHTTSARALARLRQCPPSSAHTFCGPAPTSGHWHAPTRVSVREARSCTFTREGRRSLMVACRP